MWIFFHKHKYAFRIMRIDKCVFAWNHIERTHTVCLCGLCGDPNKRENWLYAVYIRSAWPGPTSTLLSDWKLSDIIRVAKIVVARMNPANHNKNLVDRFCNILCDRWERSNEMKIIGIWGILQSGSRPCRNLGLLDSHDLGPLGYFQTPLEERNWASLVKLCQICLKHTWVVQDEELTGIAGTFE